MKFFKKINIIDVLAVILIITCLVGAYFKFFGGTSEIILQGNKRIEYVVEVKGVRNYSVTALQRGGVVSDSKTKKPIGEIISVKESPAIGDEQKADGTYVKAPIPDRYDVLVTIQTDGRISSTAYYTSTNTELCVGKEYFMNSTYGSLYCVIKEIREI